MHPAYIEVLKDSFLANFLFTADKDFALPIVLYFGVYDNNFAAAIAIFGSTLGLSATYLTFLIMALNHSFAKH